MKTKHLPLIIGISLPIIFIIIVSIIIFTPSLSIKPQHNFIYTVYDNYGYNQKYINIYTISKEQQIIVETNPLPELPIPKDVIYKKDLAPLYLYDVKTDTSHQITLEEAQKYIIDPGPSSIDGYTVKYEYNNDGIFEIFGPNGNSNGYFMEKGNARKELTGLANTDRYSYYPGNFKFIGWIK